MMRHSRSIAKSFNAAMEQIGRAIRPKSQSLRVYYAVFLVCVLIPSFSAWADINADLIRAAQQGRVEKVSMLLLDGADTNAKNANGKTALSTAAYFGNYEVVKLLLAAGASVNSTDKEGITPLIDAASGGNAKVVKALIANGADVNAKSTMGNSAVTNAQMHDSIPVMEVLAQAGADGAKNAVKKAIKNRKKMKKN